MADLPAQSPIDRAALSPLAQHGLRRLSEIMLDLVAPMPDSAFEGIEPEPLTPVGAGVGDVAAGDVETEGHTGTLNGVNGQPRPKGEHHA